MWTWTGKSVVKGVTETDLNFKETVGRLGFVFCFSPFFISHKGCALEGQAHALTINEANGVLLLDLFCQIRGISSRLIDMEGPFRLLYFFR